MRDYNKEKRGVEPGSVVSLRCKDLDPRMSPLGQKRTFSRSVAMSAIPPKADIGKRRLDVRFVPEADYSR
jgi:hypothetical protein